MVINHPSHLKCATFVATYQWQSHPVHPSASFETCHFDVSSCFVSVLPRCLGCQGPVPPGMPKDTHDQVRKKLKLDTWESLDISRYLLTIGYLGLDGEKLQKLTLFDRFLLCPIHAIPVRNDDYDYF